MFFGLVWGFGGLGHFRKILGRIWKKLGTAPPRLGFRRGVEDAVDRFDKINSRVVQTKAHGNPSGANFYRALGLPKETSLLKNTAPLLDPFCVGCLSSNPECLQRSERRDTDITTCL